DQCRAAKSDSQEIPSLPTQAGVPEVLILAHRRAPIIPCKRACQTICCLWPLQLFSDARKEAPLGEFHVKAKDALGLSRHSRADSCPRGRDRRTAACFSRACRCLLRLPSS